MRQRIPSRATNATNVQAMSVLPHIAVRTTYRLPQTSKRAVARALRARAFDEGVYSVASCPPTDLNDAAAAAPRCSLGRPQACSSKEGRMRPI